MIVHGATIKGLCKSRGVSKVTQVDAEFGMTDKGEEYISLSVDGVGAIQIPFIKLEKIIQDVRANRWSNQ